MCLCGGCSSGDWRAQQDHGAGFHASAGVGEGAGGARVRAARPAAHLRRSCALKRRLLAAWQARADLQSYEKVALNQFSQCSRGFTEDRVFGGSDPIIPEVPLCKSNFLSSAFQLFSWFSWKKINIALGGLLRKPDAGSPEPRDLGRSPMRTGLRRALRGKGPGDDRPGVRGGRRRVQRGGAAGRLLSSWKGSCAVRCVLPQPGATRATRGVMT